MIILHYNIQYVMKKLYSKKKEGDGISIRIANKFFFKVSKKDKKGGETMKICVRNHLVLTLASLMICFFSTLLLRPASAEDYPGQGKDQLVKALDIAFLNVLSSGQWRQIYESQSLENIAVNMSDCYPNPSIMVYPENPTGLLATILTNRQINVCTYETQTVGSGATFSVANQLMMRAIMDEIGNGYSLPAPIAITEVYRFGGTALFNALNNGVCDVIDAVASTGGVSVGQRRRELARFTCHIVGSGQFLHVQTGSSYQSLADLQAVPNAEICSGQLSTRLANAYFPNATVTTLIPPQDDVAECSQGVLDGTYHAFMFFDPTPALPGLRSIDPKIVWVPLTGLQETRTRIMMALMTHRTFAQTSLILASRRIPI